MSDSPDTPKPRTSWRPILPVPETAPEAPVAHHVRGHPTALFEYRDGEGRLLGTTCLFITSSGEPEYHTVTWCRSGKGTEAWRWIRFPKFRPLYGLEALAAARERAAAAPGDVLASTVSVLLCFDELSARTAFEQQLSGFDVFMSWPGGARKIEEVDWSPLRGASVAIFPNVTRKRFRVVDGDPSSGMLVPKERQPGWAAAQKIADILAGYGATVWTIIDPYSDESLPDGWNLARAVIDNWSQQEIGAWINKHLSIPAPPPPPLPACQPAPERVLPPQEPPAEEWDWQKSLLRKDGFGPLLPELHNLVQILLHHSKWKDVIYFDEFAHRVMKREAPPFDGGRSGEWSDFDDSMTHTWMSAEVGILKLKTSLVGEAVQTVAKMRRRNPVTEYLGALAWDGKPRIDDWLITYCGAGQPYSENDSEAELKQKDKVNRYLRLVGPMWLMGACKRAFEPGCKFDYVVILEGTQGLGKSSVFAILGGEWAMDTPISLSDKEGMEAIRGKWIVEIAELDSFNKVESNTAKTFFSRGADRFRMPYGRRSEDIKRGCAFGGTTNENEYFRDTTGNRRYWPVHCKRSRFDREGLVRDRDQLWAEAVHRLRAGGRVFPTFDEEVAFIRPQQSRREIADPWYEQIATWLELPDIRLDLKARRVSMTRILREACKVEVARLDERAQATRAGKILRQLGYIKREQDGQPRFYYEKGTELDD